MLILLAFYRPSVRPSIAPSRLYVRPSLLLSALCQSFYRTSLYNIISSFCQSFYRLVVSRSVFLSPFRLSINTSYFRLYVSPSIVLLSLVSLSVLITPFRLSVSPSTPLPSFYQSIVLPSLCFSFHCPIVSLFILTISSYI